MQFFLFSFAFPCGFFWFKITCNDFLCYCPGIFFANYTYLCLFLMLKESQCFSDRTLCVNVFLVVFLTNKKVLAVSYEIAVTYPRSQRKLSLSLKLIVCMLSPFEVGVLLKMLMESKLYVVILITHITMLLIFCRWLWLYAWCWFFFVCLFLVEKGVLTNV